MQEGSRFNGSRFNGLKIQEFNGATNFYSFPTVNREPAMLYLNPEPCTLIYAHPMKSACGLSRNETNYLGARRLAASRSRKTLQPGWVLKIEAGNIGPISPSRQALMA